MSEANQILFEVISVDGAIEKRDPDELISYGEMRALNEELLAFLEERGYGFGGVMRGIEPAAAVRPLEAVRRGFFDWWTLAAMLAVVAAAVIVAVVIAL